MKIPVINLVTGEGGSGGALAIGVGDALIMLQYSIYSVISPEACSTILWRNQDEAEAAAEAMGISSKRLSKLGVVDSVIEEPLGGFHKDPKDTFQRIKKTLDEYLYNLKNKNIDDLLLKRRQRYKAIGEFNEI